MNMRLSFDSSIQSVLTVLCVAVLLFLSIGTISITSAQELPPEPEGECEVGFTGVFPDCVPIIAPPVDIDLCSNIPSIQTSTEGYTVDGSICTLITTTVSGEKWSDDDGDGVRGEEGGLGGVTIMITDNDGFTATTVTSPEGGTYQFTGLTPGVTYDVCEVVPSGSIQTHPTTADELSTMITCAGNGNGYRVTPTLISEGAFGLDFGNFEPDTYEIFGFVWNDIDVDDVFEAEPILEGWTITATNVENPAEVYSDVTDSTGAYFIAVPAGTWRITQLTESGWRQLSVADGDGTYIVTVPFKKVDLSQAIPFPFNLFVQVAHAEVITKYLGPKNFGNEFVGSGSKTGSKRRSSTKETDSTTSSTPVPKVLGEATSTMPVGAPNTGAGGASHDATLPSLILAVAATRTELRKTKQ